MKFVIVLMIGMLVPKGDFKCCDCPPCPTCPDESCCSATE
jgi:hypothetical protein